MAISGQTGTNHVDLCKRPAGYLVIVDDFTEATRQVVYVERQADLPQAREPQWDELVGDCLDSGEALSVLFYAAVSHGHAAHLARREYAMASAAVRMTEEIDRHMARGSHGWIAIRLADGGSDGQLYDGAEEARAAQLHPGRCTYFPISPLSQWTTRMCEEQLTFWADPARGFLAR
ncbi:hypothetical protein [Streptomyces sp. NPDC001089]